MKVFQEQIGHIPHPEAEVQPEDGGSVELEEEEYEACPNHPFEDNINNRIQYDEKSEMPKISFTAKEVYDQSYKLSKLVPHWKTEADNPINNFIPESEKPFKQNESTFLPPLAGVARSQPKLPPLALRKIGTGPMLAGTLALSQRQTSPQTMIK